VGSPHASTSVVSGSARQICRSRPTAVGIGGVFVGRRFAAADFVEPNPRLADFVTALGGFFEDFAALSFPLVVVVFFARFFAGVARVFARDAMFYASVYVRISKLTPRTRRRNGVAQIARES
jgi:hypothetical protein